MAEQKLTALKQELEQVKNEEIPAFVPPPAPTYQAAPELSSSPKQVKIAWASDPSEPARGKRLSESVDDAFWHVVDEQGQSIECQCRCILTITLK